MYEVVSEATRGEKKKEGAPKKSLGKKVQYPKQFFPPQASGLMESSRPRFSPPPPPPLTLQQADHVTAPIRLFLSYWELSCAPTGAPPPVPEHTHVHARTHTDTQTQIGPGSFNQRLLCPLHFWPVMFIFYIGKDFWFQKISRDFMTTEIKHQLISTSSTCRYNILL